MTNSSELAVIVIAQLWLGFTSIDWSLCATGVRRALLSEREGIENMCMQYPAPAAKKKKKMCSFLHLCFDNSFYLQSIIFHALYLHNEWCIVMTGNYWVCGLLRDVSCFREEIQHKQELARANVVKTPATVMRRPAGWMWNSHTHSHIAWRQLRKTDI